MWLLINHTKPTNTVKGAVSISINRVIIQVSAIEISNIMVDGNLHS